MLRRTVLTGTLTAIAGLLLLPYLWGPIYDFPEPTHFSGSRFWNPYAALSHDWQRANFHAHGRAWFGLTNGQQSDDAVSERYRALGYDVPGVSNYQRIAAHHGTDTLPIYEHGYNIGKQHQLAIGAHAVEWLDFVFWRGLSQEQFILDRVKRKADLVALSHPKTRNAYNADNLQHLTGYDLIEIVNGRFPADEIWDAALSSGRPVWALANDDTHDLNDPQRTAMAWTMVNAPTAHTADIVSALRAGHHYAVVRSGETVTPAGTTALSAVTVASGTLTVSVTGGPSMFQFIGQDGVLRKTVGGTTEASYTFSESDTYIRAVVTGPQTVLYLNPIIRYDGQLPTPSATVNAAGTWAFRGSIVGALCVVFLASRRRPSVVAGAHPVIASAKRNAV